MERQKILLGRALETEKNESTPILLDIARLNRNMFIAGSAGSGKTNLCCLMLKELMDRGIGFLVLEAEKNECAEAMSGFPGVHVYGTDGKQAPLLGINPFAFPEGVHPAEHLVQLMEVLKSCWPMYSAIPALLKHAIESCYEACGWDLKEGTCMHEPPVFPVFRDLVEPLQEMISGAEIPEEAKAFYEGVLLTRVQAVSGGRTGRIFCGAEIPDRVLFDENTCISMDGLHSEEEGVLIMGVLLMRLKEYRMLQSVTNGGELKHVTLIEDAHHLRSLHAPDASPEGTAGVYKSAGLLTGVMAEMHGCGEGFVIADQKPSRMDVNVLRLAGSRVLFRLPDAHDRMLAGEWMHLNEMQSCKLALLEMGVAMVRQDFTEDAVLCRVDCFVPEQ